MAAARREHQERIQTRLYISGMPNTAHVPTARSKIRAFAQTLSNGTTSSLRRSRAKPTTVSPFLRACCHGEPRTDRCGSMCLDGFERAYASDRSDIIWLPEHIEAFMRVASPEMQFAMVLALHTGQRQADILRIAWTSMMALQSPFGRGRLAAWSNRTDNSCSLHESVKNHAGCSSATCGRHVDDQNRLGVQEAIFRGAMGSDLQSRRTLLIFIFTTFAERRSRCWPRRLHAPRDRFHHRAHAAACARNFGQVSGANKQACRERYRKVRERDGNRFCKTGCKMRWAK